MKKISFVLAASLLSGCFGYQPLYSGVKSDMRDVYVSRVEMKTLDNRAGERLVAQSVSNQLASYFTGNDSSSYRIQISLEESKKALALRRDATEDRLQLNLLARVQLLSGEGKVLFETDVKAAAPYSVEVSPLSTDFGKENARQNLAKVVAEEVRQRIAQYLYTASQTEPDDS